MQPIVHILLTTLLMSALSCGTPQEEVVSPVELTPSPQTPPETSKEVSRMTVRTIRKIPHSPEAFTQGLLWHEGAVFESTGQYGQSSLRELGFPSGKVQRKRSLEGQYFGEGLARIDDALFQLTWRRGEVFVWNIEDFERRRSMSYSGEGWGLCNDAGTLVMSDGSDTLTFRDPKTFATQRSLKVRKNGIPVRALNELECVGDAIYANVWRTDEIVIIDKNSGVVTGVIDASGLLSAAEHARADVLNGIAYLPESGHFLITGKYWPWLFEVAFEESP